MKEKSSAARLDSLYIVFLFYLGGYIVQRQIALPAPLTGFNSTSQRSRLIFLAFKQPQGRTHDFTG
ncbi:hypothetical protein HORIV_49470 [Vreelandella olivaria]|uniref:Uncharacterized protein n=1 Tax=Vreelandella olivaria TaxID=390919 RepID=A0ABM7GPE9_9GAMM|nr:hypothetical protein HORIV_49470 [Halomonas olivaria]